MIGTGTIGNAAANHLPDTRTADWHPPPFVGKQFVDWDVVNLSLDDRDRWFTVQIYKSAAEVSGSSITVRCDQVEPIYTEAYWTKGVSTSDQKAIGEELTAEVGASGSIGAAEVYTKVAGKISRHTTVSTDISTSESMTIKQNYMLEPYKGKEYETYVLSYVINSET